jgi:hypothetical protein
MSQAITIEALQQHIAALEAELTRLHPIEAAAREAYAFLAGRRPGFAHNYARDVLAAALESNKPGSGNSRPKPTQSTKRRKRA